MKADEEMILIPKKSFTKLCRDYTRSMNMIKVLTLVCDVQQVSLVLPVTVYCSHLNIDMKAIDTAVQKGWIKAKIVSGYQVVDAYGMALRAPSGKISRRSPSVPGFTSPPQAKTPG